MLLELYQLKYTIKLETAMLPPVLWTNVIANFLQCLGIDFARTTTIPSW